MKIRSGQQLLIVTIVLALFGGLGSEPISLGSYDSCYMTHFWRLITRKYSSFSAICKEMLIDCVQGDCLHSGGACTVI